MPIVTLPVAPLSRKILLTKYGPAEPIHLGARNLLYRQLSYRPESGGRVERHQQALTTTIQIQTSRHLAERMKVNPRDLGYHLYQLHKEEMFTWVAGKVSVSADNPEVTVVQKYAIRDFLAAHNVEEDDFSLDTACRIWQRFRESRGKFTPRNVPYFSPAFCVQLTPLQAQSVSNKIKHIALFYCDNFHRQTQMVFLPYIMYRYTHNTLQRTAQELHRDFRRVHRSVQRAEIALKNYPRLREVIDYAILSTLQEAV